MSQIQHDHPAAASPGETTAAAPAIVVTASAARRIRQIVEAESGPSMLRIAVNGGGCSGFRYDFSLESQVADDDVRFERDGAVVLVDAMSLDILAGSEVDFVDDLIGAAFQIRNPQAKSSCGCGTSFAIG